MLKQEVKEILKNLRCTVCDRYLSRKPILHGKICGRCVVPKDNYPTRNVQYEALASQIAFPCINNLNGCHYAGSFNELALHEDTGCSYRLYNCPSGCTWSGTAIELVLHYKKDHANFYVEESASLSIDKFLRIWLVEKDELYFLILAEIVGSHLEVSIFYFTPKYKTTANISYDIMVNNTLATYTTFKNKGALYIFHAKQFCGKPHYCFPLDPTTTHSGIKFGVKFDLTFLQSTQQLDSIQCDRCKVNIASPIYSCSLYHKICIDCTDYLELNFCIICEDHSTLTNDTKLENLTGLYQYTCMWENCNQVFSGRYIRRHEQFCSFRNYSCVGCSWSGLYDDYYNHYQSTVHGSKRNQLHFSSQIVTAGLEPETEKSYYAIAHRELFLCQIIPEDFGNIVNVCNSGRVGFFEDYRYEVDIKHATDDLCPYNRTYKLEGTGFGTVTIPTSDILLFEGSNNHNFTIRIIKV